VVRLKGGAFGALPTVTLGDSTTVEVGNLVLAIGAPFGLPQSVTQGIISATARGDDNADYLQTDAPINPGSSGGPLVNMRGEVIGVNTAIASGVGQFVGVGFSVPSNVARRVLPRLLRGERIVRGHLEIEAVDLDDELAAQLGVAVRGPLVTEADPGVKLVPGDVVLSYRGQPIVDARRFAAKVAATAPGARAELEVLREGIRRRMTVVISPDPDDAAPPSRPPVDRRHDLARLGISARTSSGGVLLAGVEPKSFASLGGLSAGDLILAVGRAKVGSVEELERALASSQDHGHLLLLVERGGERRYVIVPVH